MTAPLSAIPSPAKSVAHAESSMARGLIEIGVVIAGQVDAIDRRAITLGLQQVREFLQLHFEEFHFEISPLRRPELAVASRAEPSVLLQQAVQERDLRHWDFVIVLTAAELKGSYMPYCFAALSRPLDAAIISLSLIDPIAAGETLDEARRTERIAFRLSRLLLHALGHLSGLPRSDVPTELLFHPADASELDAMFSFSAEQRARQRAALAEIADQRLEEGIGLRMSWPTFVVRAAWINRREIGQAIVAARPWQFPQRLSRLTIAAVSTITILYMTAEAWDLALTQKWWQIALLSAGTLGVTTAYVVVRQQLLVRRGRRRSEQTVVTSASALGIVLSGMFVTWVLISLLGNGLSWLLFDPQLIASWAAASDLAADAVRPAHRLNMSLFSASLGLLIGALGASFESQTYFRHIIFVDEEL